MSQAIQVIERFGVMAYGSYAAARRTADARLDQLIALGYIGSVKLAFSSELGDVLLVRAWLREAVPFRTIRQGVYHADDLDDRIRRVHET